MNQLQSIPLERLSWDVTATVHVHAIDAHHTAALTDELQAACAPTLGRVACCAQAQRSEAQGRPGVRLQVDKRATWAGCDAAAVAARLRVTALALWRVCGRWAVVYLEARNGRGDCLTQRLGWHEGLAGVLGSTDTGATPPTLSCDPDGPGVELELEVTTYDGRAEAVRAALERVWAWQWDAQPYGLLGRAHGLLPLPFGRFVQALGARIWLCSPGAGVLLYVHAAGERLVLERALGLPAYRAWARTQSSVLRPVLPRAGRGGARV